LAGAPGLVFWVVLQSVHVISQFGQLQEAMQPFRSLRACPYLLAVRHNLYSLATR